MHNNITTTIEPLEENHNTTITITPHEQALRKKENSGKESK